MLVVLAVAASGSGLAAGVCFRRRLPNRLLPAPRTASSMSSALLDRKPGNARSRCCCSSPSCSSLPVTGFRPSSAHATRFLNSSYVATDVIARFFISFTR